MVTSISERGQTGKGSRVFLTIFFFIFFAVGCGIFYPFFIQPALKIIEAKEWDRVQAVVQSSHVESHAGDDSTTYSVEITYTYQIRGETYTSDRYSFMGGSSSGYSGKKEIVDQHPPGKRIWCYVNPEDPYEAVLERGFTATMFFGLIPLIFVMVGAGGMYFTWRGSGKSKRTPLESTMATGEMRPGIVVPEEPWLPRLLHRANTLPSGEVVLESQVSPMTKVIGTLIFALIWNGIVSIFLVDVVQGWMRGRPDWFATIFLTPFLLIGIGCFVMMGYFILALANPRPKLIVNSLAVPLGGRLQLRWELSGKVEKVSDLKISLQGTEEARYRRGTSTYTDREKFYSQEISHVVPPNDMRQGRATVEIPEETMHSFEGGYNKILWSIEVHGDIKNWPDIKEEFPIIILPPQGS